MTGGSQCLDEGAALSFIEGKLSQERRQAVEEHLDRCDSCRRMLGVVARLREAEAPPSTASAPTLPGGSERYTVLAERARGGQARILLAFDENVGREVALKELLPSTGAPADDSSWNRSAARFLREAELTGKLVHPGVVPVFEIGRRPDGTLFYTMQLVRGHTLSEVLRERKDLPDRLALLGHFLSICHVVAYAHSRGILHRDLKPKNIMVGEFGETVLLDWGLAKQRREPEEGQPTVAQPPPETSETETLAGTIIGTPGYMSPEQASGDIPNIDERSDVYGLGAVLFEILSQKSPPAQTRGAARMPPRVRSI